MNLEDFDDALLRWGADLNRWPDDARQAGEELLATNSKAVSLMQEMTAFGITLEASVMEGTAAGAIAARVQQGVIERAESRGLFSFLPIGRILGWGTIAGAGGSVVAALLPAGTGTSALLAIAAGGVLP